MADVDDVDALRAAAVVDREQVAAGEREQLAHAVGLQAPRDQPAAVQGLWSLRPRSSWRGNLPPGRGVRAASRPGSRARRATSVRRHGHDTEHRRLHGRPRAAAARVRPRGSDPPRDPRRRAGPGGGDRLPDPRRARLARSADAQRAAAAACMRAAAAASATRFSPQNSDRPTRSAGQPVGARGQQAAARRPRSRRRARRRRAALQAAVHADAGRRGRLGQDLRIVEVEAAAEREPAGGEHERRAAALLGRVGRRAHRGRHRRREALGPHERQPQLGRAALGGDAPRSAAPPDRRRSSRSAATSCRPGVQITSSKRALDALGREVRERAAQVEEELHARRRVPRACSGCGAPPCAPPA